MSSSSRSTACPASWFSAVAMSASSGGSSPDAAVGQFTLSPSPTTTASSTPSFTVDSARMPLSLRAGPDPDPDPDPVTTRSFGHLSPGATSATIRHASAALTPTAVLRRWASDTGVVGRNSTENSNDPSGGACHERSSRPRPAV